jgi:hypothetical protein
MTKIQLKRGLETELPTLSEGEPAFTTDTGKIFIGATSGNIQLAKKDDLDKLQPTGFVPNNGSWVSSDGQDTFQITNGNIIDVKLITVVVGGVVQPDITLVNNTTFQLPETLSAGIDVYAEWYEIPVPITLGHHKTHESGGQDELDITKLKNYNILNSQITDMCVNVKSFGAKGDGITDDTAAIQNAINSSPLGSIIFFPAGTYMISNNIALSPNRTYMGVGWNSSIKQMNGKNLVQMINLRDETSQHPNIIIKDLQFDGNRDNNTSTVGLYLFGLLNSMLYRVRVQNCGGTGYFLEGNSTIQSSTNHFIDCWAFQNTGYGIYFSGACADNHIIGGDYGANWNCALYIAGVSSSVRDATMWGTQSGSCVIVAGVSNQLTSNNIEGASGHGVEVQASHNFLTGNKIYDNANVSSAYGNYDGVYISNNAENVVITGNDIYAGLYSNTGYYRYAINLDTHSNCEINNNAVRYAKTNGAINKSSNPINGLKDGDIYNGTLITTTATRPTSAPLTQRAFDQTLSKEIMWNGTAWTDLMGTNV